MKALLVACGLLLLAFSARVQRASDFRQFNDVVFSLVSGIEQVSLYTSLPDTLGRRPSQRLSRLNVVAVAGEFSPRWAVVRRGDFYYFVRQSELAGLRPGQTTRQVADLLRAPLPLNERRFIDFARVVEVPGASKNELYARGKVWFANTFESTRNVIQADDKEAGVLIGKAWHTIYLVNERGGLTDVRLWYTVKLAFKDGRYRYDLTDFLLSSYPQELSPQAAEPLVFAARSNGTPTADARLYTTALGQGAYFMQAALEASMIRPAIGSDF